MNIFLKTIRYLLNIYNVAITRLSTLEKLIQDSEEYRCIQLKLKVIQALNNLNSNNAKFLLSNFSNSKSQIYQDLFVLSHFNFKHNGYFVEFGATNGVDFSNTYLMEKDFNWTGILSEPAKFWHKDLFNNRLCNIDTSCVWENSYSSLIFRETVTPGLSTIDNFSNSDYHHSARQHGKTYAVNSISLVDLLKKYNAPSQIDYLSIDTEGSEYQILENFDFSSYSFGVITCEHNYSPMRDKINSLLINQGYKRVFQEFSFFDDYYIKTDYSSIKILR